MTTAAFIAAIRQIPGINSVTRWQKHGQDRLYIKFSVSDPGAETFVDLKCGIIFGFTGTWKSDPHDLGERAIRAVRALCGPYSKAIAEAQKRERSVRT